MKELLPEGVTATILADRGFGDVKLFEYLATLRFGMGMSTLRIDDPQRRDRLLLLNAFAIMLLTLLVRRRWRKPRNGPATN